MSSRAGQLLIISAPSGSGKTTLARRFLAANPDAAFSVSVTTRAPRGAELEGVDYSFVDAGRFDRLAQEGAFAEWAEVHGHRYGTPRSSVDRAIAAGRVAVFDIDVQGGASIHAAWPTCSTRVFILPPSMEELERRLRSRHTDSEEVILRRLANARAEVEHGGRCYDYLIVNDDLDAALARIGAVAAYERSLLEGIPDRGSEREAAKWRRGWLDVSAWLSGARSS